MSSLAVVALAGSLPASARLLLTLGVVVLLADLGGRAARAGRQPAVLGQIAVGVLLGPGALGAVAPDVWEALFPEAVVPQLRAVAQLGLVLFMFLVGREVDPAHVRGSGRAAVVVSQTSIVVPFALGAGLAVWVHDVLAPSVPLLDFSLFVGIAMSISAFPVLARILQELDLADTRVGALALTCAAVDDVTAWCALAVVVSVTGSAGWGSAALTLGATLVFVAVMLGVVRPWVARRPPVPLPVAVAAAVGSAFVTEWIGIHAIFGAFVAGLVVGSARRDVTSPDRDPIGALEPVVSGVLLPAFFVVVGASTRLGNLDRVERWLVLGAVLVVAVVGKLGGTFVAARLVGESARVAWTLGVLLNTRGLTEIVILTVGLDLGVIDETMFTIMVVMALVTTFAAGPLLAGRDLDAARGDDLPRGADGATLVPPDALE